MVKGTASLKEGKGEVFLEVDRKVIFYPLQKIDTKASDWETKVRANYDAANNKILIRKDVVVKQSRFNAELLLPKEVLPGKYVVKAYIHSNNNEAFGAAPLTVPD